MKNLTYFIIYSYAFSIERFFSTLKYDKKYIINLVTTCNNFQDLRINMIEHRNRMLNQFSFKCYR